MKIFGFRYPAYHTLCDIKISAVEPICLRDEKFLFSVCYYNDYSPMQHILLIHVGMFQNIKVSTVVLERLNIPFFLVSFWAAFWWAGAALFGSSLQITFNIVGISKQTEHKFVKKSYNH